MSFRNVAIILGTIGLSAPFVVAEERDLASELVSRNAPQAIPEAPLIERVDQYSSVIPSELERDTVADYISRLQMEKQYIDALLERNQSLKDLNNMHRTPIQSSVSDGSNNQPEGNFNNQTSFRGGDGFPTGDMTTSSFSPPRLGNPGQPAEPRYAALDYTFALGGERVARVQWGESYPTVKMGDVLPGGFRVSEITPDEIIIEKEGVVVRMNQDRVSIDALMRAISEQRAQAGQ
jgi:hypothetical protein